MRTCAIASWDKCVRSGEGVCADGQDAVAPVQRYGLETDENLAGFWMDFGDVPKSQAVEAFLLGKVVLLESSGRHGFEIREFCLDPVNESCSVLW